MPLYVYECPNCGKQKEIIHKVAETPEEGELQCNCETQGPLVRKITAHKGYCIEGNNTSSTRPKSAGCMK